MDGNRKEFKFSFWLPMNEISSLDSGYKSNFLKEEFTQKSFFIKNQNKRAKNMKNYKFFFFMPCDKILYYTLS